MNDALLARVLAHPDDDGARLVLADALHDQGDPRGELINLECRLARIPEDEWGPDELEAAAREQALLTANEHRWVQPWPLELVPIFARGFPDTQHGRSRDFVVHAERLFAKAPTLRAIQLTDEDPRAWDERFAALLAMPQLTRLHRLGLPVTFHARNAATLAAAPLSGLDGLSFRGGELTDAGAEQLARGNFAGLRELVLEYDVGVTARGLGALGTFELTAYSNTGNAIGEAGLRHIAGAWPKLARLTLSRVNAGGVEHLRALPLERLELLDVELGRREVDALLGGGHPTVRRLGLSKERIERASLTSLSRWSGLDALGLTHCALGDAGLEVLSRSAIAPRLKCLWLDGNGLTDACVPLLQAFTSLKRLSLNANPVSPAALGRLPRSIALGA